MNQKAANLLTVCAILAFAAAFALKYYADKRQKETQDTQWINPEDIQPGPIQTANLDDEQIQRITRLQRVFSEVDPTPLEKWIEDFKRDLYPEREIRIWEAMADAYQRYCQSKELSPAAKKEVFSLLLIRSGTSADDVLENVELHILTEDEAKDVLACYSYEPKPIEVISK